MAPLRIEVTGKSTIYRPAERAIISLTAQHEAFQSETAVQKVMNASEQLRAILGRLSNTDEKHPLAAITEWSNSTLSSGSYIRFGNLIEQNGRETVYSASMSFEATFQDFSKLGSFAASVLLMEDIRVNSINWKLTDSTVNSLGTVSHRDALNNALKKAEDFTAVLGVTKAQVTEIKECPEPDGGMARSFAFSAPRGNREQALDFTPAKVALHCHVLVTLQKY